MDGRNRPLVTDEPVEFERKKPVEVQDVSKIMDWFRRIYGICPQFSKRKLPLPPKDQNIVSTTGWTSTQLAL